MWCVFSILPYFFINPRKKLCLCYRMVLCVLVPLNLAFPCLQWAFVSDLISQQGVVKEFLEY